MDIEQKWIDIINYKYKGKQNLNRKRLTLVEKLINVSKNNIIDTENFTFAEIKNIKDLIVTYKIPSVFIAYVDGEENGVKLKFTRNDVLFYVVDDSTDIVELMLNEYYSNYIYLIPKKYLSVDKRGHYKILDYNKSELISKNERSRKRIEISDKKSYMKAVHRFIMQKIILGKK